MIVWFLIFGGSFFAALGVVYFKYVSNLPLTYTNVFIFVVGAFPGALAPVNIYALMTGQSGRTGGPLENTLAEFAALASIPIGAVGGGALATFVVAKIRSAIRSH